MYDKWIGQVGVISYWCWIGSIFLVGVGADIYAGDTLIVLDGYCSVHVFSYRCIGI